MKIHITKSLAMNREESGALVFTKGKLLGSIIRIRDGKEITIGRDAAKSDIVINSMTISRLHCKVMYQKSTGCYKVVDCSKNGVYKSDGSRLPTGEEVGINAGEELWLGDEDNMVRLG